MRQRTRSTRPSGYVRRTAALAALTAAGAAALGACGSDDDDAASGRIEISAIDYAYVGVPETVRAGATLAMQNDSGKEAHEVVAVRLPDDETRPVADLMKLPPDQLAVFFPGVQTVLIAGPGDAGIAVEGDGTLSEPGRYALICVIPTDADPAEYLAAAAEAEGGPPDVAGGPPHIVNGMFAELTVVE